MNQRPQRLRSSERLRHKRDFERVYSKGRQLVGRYFVVFWLEQPKGFLRVGVVASRRVGGAVARNRAKRILREIFRRNRPGRSVSADVVLVARAAIVEAKYGDVEAAYRRSIKEVVETLP